MRPDDSSSVRHLRRSFLHARGGLVAVLGSLGEELQEELFDWSGYALHALAGRFRRSCDVEWIHSVASAAVKEARR